MLGESLQSTDGKLLGSDDGIKVGLFDIKLFGTILGNLYGIIPGLGVGIE